MVRAQAMLLDRLGIETLFCVIGGSMGGMQVLQWTAAYPERVFSALPVACSTRHSAQNIAFHELGRQAVMADPDWHHGRYFERSTHPHRGLAVARMAGHITYLSDAALHRKFGRRMQDRELPTFSFDADFQVESYLRYQGSSFVERFDANSYLYLTRAMDYFDIAADHDGVLAQAFRGIKTRFCVVSFTSDWLFPTSESRALVHALNASSARVSFAEIETDRGHDAFLLDVPEFFDISRAFLQSAGKARGLGKIRVADMALQEQALPLGGVAPDRTGKYRTDHLLVAEMVARGSKVLDVGCGDGELLQLLESRGIDGRGIELSREGVNRCVAKGLAVVQGDADTDLVNYPDDAFDYVILSQTLQATRQPKVGAGKSAADRPARHRLVPEFRLLEDAAAISGRRPHAAHRKSPGDLVRHAEHPFLHHQGFRAALRRDQRQDGARGGARSLRPPGAADPALVGLEHVRRAGRVFAEPGRGGEVATAVIPGRAKRSKPGIHSSA